MTQGAAQPPRRRAITGRALVLGTLVIVLLVLLASPLHRYFASRGDVQHARQQLQQDQKSLAELRTQQQQWSDPGFIQAQARQRLMYAMPGDTVYVVVRPGQKTKIQQTSNATVAEQQTTWNQRLWQTVQAAGK